MVPISVAFVDDHPLLLAGISSLFSAKSDFNVVATGVSASDAVDIAARFAPDVIVVDLSMPGNVFDAIAEIVRRPQDTKVLAYTAAVGIEHAVSALDAGASGYVLKGSTAEELMEGIRTVHSGETFITPGFANKVIVALRTASLRKTSAQAIRLSAREEQIVRQLLRGLTNREIAQNLSIGEKTVKHYMTILMQKLHARNRIGVVIAAQKMDMDIQERASPYSRHQQ